jgi:hypothetical protein
MENNLNPPLILRKETRRILDTVKSNSDEVLEA